MTKNANPVVCSFESRRADEMCALIQRHGGQALSAPSMREIPIEDNPVAMQFVRDFIMGEYPIMILLTGVGTEALFEVARMIDSYQALLEALDCATVIVRGPKPAAVLNKVRLKYTVRAPEPNTWKELVAAIDGAGIDLKKQAVAVQEYGLPNTRLYAELEARGAIVTPVPVYRWALPEDTTALEHALRETAAGRVDVLLFTSANQISNILLVAENLNLVAEIREALSNRTHVGSIGPTCSEAIRDNGFPVHYEASPPKMGQLVRGAIGHWKESQCSSDV